MVVKILKNQKHIDDLIEVFKILQRHRLRLNADKCAFGVGARNFLGYMITHRELEANLDQISVIELLKPLSNPKDAQKLIGMIAALKRFILRSADECRPFYQLLKKWKGFL